jgi:hypothetical protein
MDSAYFEDLAGRLYGLLIGLDDRVGSEQAQWLHHVIDVGEYGLALEDIAGTLAQDAIAVTDQERGRPCSRIWPPAGSSPPSARARLLLPQPDSPTRPSAWPRARLSDTPRTARTGGRPP